MVHSNTGMTFYMMIFTFPSTHLLISNTSPFNQASLKHQPVTLHMTGRARVENEYVKQLVKRIDPSSILDQSLKPSNVEKKTMKLRYVNVNYVMWCFREKHYLSFYWVFTYIWLTLCHYYCTVALLLLLLPLCGSGIEWCKMPFSLFAPINSDAITNKMLFNKMRLNCDPYPTYMLHVGILLNLVFI